MLQRYSELKKFSAISLLLLFSAVYMAFFHRRESEDAEFSLRSYTPLCVTSISPVLCGSCTVFLPERTREKEELS
jgi:hypothetical protein